MKRTQPRNNQSRFIIYCRYKSECELLAKFLKYKFYHSSTGSNEEKGSIFERWLDRKHVIICYTQAFGAGLNYPRVNGVFFVGTQNEPLEFLQAIKRAGRSGQGAFCITLLDRGQKSSFSARIEPLINLKELVVKHSLLGKECRAKALSEYVDSVTQYCENVTNRCDVCEQKGNFNPDFHNQTAGPDQCSQSAVQENKREKKFNSGIKSEHMTSLRTPINCKKSQIVLSRARENAHELKGFLKSLRLMIGRCGLCQMLKHDARHVFD